MARLKAAGLNPNLVYGTGADATMSSPVRGSSPGSYNPTAPQVDMSGVANAGLAYQDVRLKEAQIDVAEQQKLKMAADTMNALTGNKNSEFDLKMKNDLKQINMEAAEKDLVKKRADAENAWSQATISDETMSANIQKAKAEASKALNEAGASQHLEKRVLQEIDNLKKDGDLKQFNINLNRLGINQSDPFYLRILTQLFGKYVPKP